MKRTDILNSGDSVFAKFHLLKIDKAIEFINFGDKIILQIQLFKQLATINTFDPGYHVALQVDLTQVRQFFKALHGGELYVCQVYTLN
jgi:hypothetical protein